MKPQGKLPDREVNKTKSRHEYSPSFYPAFTMEINKASLLWRIALMTYFPAFSFPTQHL